MKFLTLLLIIMNLITAYFGYQEYIKSSESLDMLAQTRSQLSKLNHIIKDLEAERAIRYQQLDSMKENLSKAKAELEANLARIMEFQRTIESIEVELSKTKADLKAAHSEEEELESSKGE